MIRNQRTRGARGTRRNTSRPMVTSVSTQRTTKLVNAVTPFRVAGNQQLVSVPNHNYQLKMRKVFRVFAATPAASETVSTTSVIAAIRSELGIAVGAVGTGEIVALHDFRAYSVIPNLGTLAASALNTLAVQLFDIEESSAAARSAFFEDVGSPAGVTHVKAVYPANNRPTFTSSAANATLALVAAPTNGVLVIDLDITYIRTTTAPP